MSALERIKKQAKEYVSDNRDAQSQRDWRCNYSRNISDVQEQWRSDHVKGGKGLPKGSGWCGYSNLERPSVKDVSNVRRFYKCSRCWGRISVDERCPLCNESVCAAPVVQARRRSALVAAAPVARIGF